MNQLPSLQQTGPVVWWGMVVVLLWLVPSSAMAGDEGLCKEWAKAASEEGGAWMAMTPDGWTPDSSTSPCEAAHVSTPAYNCSIAYGAASKAENLARQQAQKVVFSTLRSVYVTGGDEEERLFSSETTSEATSMAWLKDMAASLTRVNSVFDHRAMCVPRVDGEECESAPPVAAVVSFGSSSPVHRDSVDFEIPWRPGNNELMQPAVVELRVGPSDEHRRLLERPPPV